jgi:hypothetical protein
MYFLLFNQHFSTFFHFINFPIFYYSQIQDLSITNNINVDPLRKPYLKSDSMMSIRDVKAYVLLKIIQYQQVMEEHLRAMSIEIYTERADQVGCVCGVCI